jgi:hypothetical protein
MSAESLARADADLVDALRRLHQCRRDLDEATQRHDAAAVARLQSEIDALVALKDSARQLRDAEHASLHATVHPSVISDLPHATGTETDSHGSQNTCRAARESCTDASSSIVCARLKATRGC